MAANVYRKPFYVPPTVSSPYPGTIPSGQIVLYKDSNWNSTSYTINTQSSKFPEGRAFSFSGTPLQDTATWIAFNLPVGTVCTLFDNVVTNQPSNPYNFAGAGVCVDLIGSGQLETVDLYPYGANDRLSGGIWRTVTMSEGWFQLFRDTDCSGQFCTFFLDEWPTATVNSLDGWALDREASSINFPCLTPVQILALNANTNGSGEQVSLGATNPFGSSDTPATVNFTESGMNDRIRAFSYSVIQPQNAVIQSVSTQFTAGISAGNTFNASVSATNSASTDVPIQLMLAESQTYDISSTTTLEYSMCLSVSATVSASAGVPDVDSVEASTTTSFSATTTATSSSTYGSSQTFELQQTVTFTAPARSNYSATASVSVGEIPMTKVTTTGKFYYSQNLPGSVLDPVSGLYVLTSPVTVNLAGGVGTQITFNTSSTPIS